MKIYLYFIGKPKDPHANAIAADFLAAPPATRPAKCAKSVPSGSISGTNIPPPARSSSTRPASRWIPPAFARLIAKAEMEGRDLVFLIGGHDGLPRRMGRARRPAGLALAP